MEKRGMRGLFQINPVTKTGQRLYMVHMLLLPFLPITALIIQAGVIRVTQNKGFYPLV